MASQDLYSGENLSDVLSMNDFATCFVYSDSHVSCGCDGKVYAPCCNCGLWIFPMMEEVYPWIGGRRYAQLSTHLELNHYCYAFVATVTR